LVAAAERNRRRPERSLGRRTMDSIATAGFLALGIAGYLVAAVRLWEFSSATGLALISVAIGIAFILLGLFAAKLRQRP
jgi:hypothetical protein